MSPVRSINRKPPRYGCHRLGDFLLRLVGKEELGNERVAETLSLRHVFCLRDEDPKFVVGDLVHIHVEGWQRDLASWHLEISSVHRLVCPHCEGGTLYFHHVVSGQRRGRRHFNLLLTRALFVR